MTILHNFVGYRGIKTINNLYKHAHRRLVGSRALRQRALRRYRTSLSDKHSLVRLPFRAASPIDMRQIYVPIELNEETTPLAALDDFKAIEEYPRIVIVGPPGSGKSMLLKRLILSYADGQLRGTLSTTIPVLLALHRLNQGRVSLRDEITRQLERDGILNADRFVDRALHRGTLLLLLDGLDEVSRRRRPEVVSELSDLVERYNGCRFVLTCRDAVYRGELLQQSTRLLRTVPLSDHQIHTFLRPWESDMRADRAIDQLVRVLHERPRIMSLARNPLLLTVIAYLYFDRSSELPSFPHSRCEFYDTATTILLAEWHAEIEAELGRFDAVEKRAVLEDLALAMQDSSTHPSEDRLTIRVESAIGRATAVLTKFGRPDGTGRAILKEIVARSGLLLEIEGGRQYQFSHLTLEEYYAAMALGGRPDELLSRYRRDSEGWRETVKLWCGGAWNCTWTIEEIARTAPTLALECLADARSVDEELSAKLISDAKSQLATDDTVLMAFASVASDPRPRGRAAFTHLESLLTARPTEPILGQSELASGQAVAARALSATNVPRAAELLARCDLSMPAIRDALVRMGDISVAAVRSLVDATETPAECVLIALDILLAIGTPAAARALEEMLWHGDQDRAAAAAWRLATLLPRRDVEEALASKPVADFMRLPPRIDWVWSPFEESDELSALGLRAGRIAWLVNSSLKVDPSIGPRRIDPRIGIPLSVLNPPKLPAKMKVDGRMVELMRAISEEAGSPGLVRNEAVRRLRVPEDGEMWVHDLAGYLRPDSAAKRDLLFSVLDSVCPQPSAWRILIGQLPSAIQEELVVAVLAIPRPTQSDWEQVARPVRYEFSKGWHYRLTIIIGIAAVVIAAGQAIVAREPSLGSGWISIILGFVSLLAIPAFISSWNDASTAGMFLLGPLLGALILKEGIDSRSSGDVVFGGILALVPSTTYASILLYGSVWWRNYLPRMGVLVVWIVLSSLCWVLAKRGMRWDRAARNPLQPVLAKVEA